MASSIANKISNFYHIDISCDGCSNQSFNGRRYINVKNVHQVIIHVKIAMENKYIQHPALHANNQQMFGLRTSILAEKKW